MFTLEEAYEALNGRKEFVVKKYDGKICFDYQVILPDSFAVDLKEIMDRVDYFWENSICHGDDSFSTLEQAKKDVDKFTRIRRNFRGVHFDAATGEMISLPLHKFFNVNQIPETQFHLIKDQEATIYEKLDGSMIQFFIHNGELQAATRRSTLFAGPALELAKKNGLEEKIQKTVEDGYTPIFEYVAPNNQIVVLYPSSRLVYLISRNRKDGSYFFDESFEDRAKTYNFKFSDIMNNTDVSEFEGYVCHLSNMIVKVKTPWYLQRHRAVDALMKPAYKLYEIVYQGLMDDLISVATDNYKPVLKKIWEEAQTDLLNAKNKAEQQYEEAYKEHLRIVDPNADERKKRAIFVELAKKTDNFSVTMALFAGKSVDAMLTKQLMERYRTKYADKLYVGLGDGDAQ